LNTFKTFSVYLISGFLNKGIAFLFLPLFTAYLQPSELGIVTLFSTSVLFLTPFVSLSVATSISTDFFKQSASDFRRYFSTVLLLPVAVTLLCYLVLLFLKTEIANRLGLNANYLFLLPVLALFGFIYEIFLALLRNKEEAFKYGILTFIRTVGELALALLFIVHLSMSWKGRIWSWFIISLVLAVYALYYFKKSDYFTKNIDKTYYQPELKYSIPIIINQLATFMVISSDRFFIAKYLNTDQVGIYGVATQIGAIVFAFSSSFIMSFYPFLYNELGKNDTVSKQPIFKKIIQMAGAMFIISLAIVIINPLIYQYFINEKYHAGEHYVKWIITAYYFWFIYWMMLGFLYYFKLNKIIFLTSIFTALLAFVAGNWFVSNYGTIGAVYSLNLCCFSTMMILIILKFRLKLY
jgi:O-antigen/teichoic acid export membrane protein